MEDSDILNAHKVRSLIGRFCDAAQEEGCNLIELRYACSALMASSESMIRERMEELKRERGSAEQ